MDSFTCPEGNNRVTLVLTMGECRHIKKGLAHLLSSLTNQDGWNPTIHALNEAVLNGIVVLELQNQTSEPEPRVYTHATGGSIEQDPFSAQGEVYDEDMDEEYYEDEDEDSEY